MYLIILHAHIPYMIYVSHLYRVEVTEQHIPIENIISKATVNVTGYHGVHHVNMFIYCADFDLFFK